MTGSHDKPLICFVSEWMRYPPRLMEDLLQWLSVLVNNWFWPV